MTIKILPVTAIPRRLERTRVGVLGVIPIYGVGVAENGGRFLE